MTPSLQLHTRRGSTPEQKRAHYYKNRDSILKKLSLKRDLRQKAKLATISNPDCLKCKADVQQKLQRMLRSGFGNFLHRARDAERFSLFTKLIGCSYSQFKLYIESQFQEGMSWDNRSLWHFDHFLPLASFDLSDPNEYAMAAHYTNIQPLWAEHNWAKGTSTSFQSHTATASASGGAHRQNWLPEEPST